MKLTDSILLADLTSPINRLLELAATKIRSLARSWDVRNGTPVFTVDGQYTTRGWTEWTQGFQYGCAILAFDALGDEELLEIGRSSTLKFMAPHVSHIGVHDHGFNNLSTYGNLRRLMREGRIPHNDWELAFYELALKASGAVQAARWQGINVNGQPSRHAANTSTLGYVYSFNGPHSLFVDTMRTIRILGVAWQLGQRLMHENDRAADLLKRSVLHGLATSQYILFHGDSEHTYDVRGRTAHEAIFNRNDGVFRCRSSQQGYSPFSTWTRGLAWAMLGFVEELEFLERIDQETFKASVGLEKSAVIKVYEDAAVATCKHYMNDVTASDGIPYWDDGAPNLHRLDDWKSKPAEPLNDFEPVDSSAAAIAAQALLRLGIHFGELKYLNAGALVTRTLFSEPYLSVNPSHQGLILHSIYHRPNGWDHVPAGEKVPCGESSMWGDYHAMELAVYLKRLIEKKPYLAFFDSKDPR